MNTPNQMQLEQINKNLTLLSEQIGELSDQVKKLENHLYNDSQTGTYGMVYRMQNHDTRITNLEENDRKKTWFIAKLSAAIPIVITVLYEVIKYFATKK